jgi:hypothetical protein
VEQLERVEAPNTFLGVLGDLGSAAPLPPLASDPGAGHFPSDAKDPDGQGVWTVAGPRPDAAPLLWPPDFQVGASASRSGTLGTAGETEPKAFSGTANGATSGDPTISIATTLVLLPEMFAAKLQETP